MLIGAVRGLSIFQEYVDNPQAMAEAFDARGFFRTGDRVTLHEDGWIQFKDRVKDMIKVGGESVSASEVEAAIAGVGGIAEVEQYVICSRRCKTSSIKAHQPMPRLYVSPTEAPNAFATGRNPSNAAVCCTEGILQLLDERELRGVFGHELMHVYNRDILTSSVAAAIAGMITSIAQIAMFSSSAAAATTGPAATRRPARDDPARAVAATLIQLAISRTREYDADEDGARPDRRPAGPGLGAAQARAGDPARPLPPARELVNTSHLMIANPFRPAASPSCSRPTRRWPTGSTGSRRWPATSADLITAALIRPDPADRADGALATMSPWHPRVRRPDRVRRPVRR